MDSRIEAAGSTVAPAASARALLSGVVDYAGLFPPAGLAMPDAVQEYARAQQGPNAWLLGRFVLPAARIAEFAAARAAGPDLDREWLLSAIVRDGQAADIEAVAAQPAAGARVDTVESRPETPEGVDRLAELFGEAYDLYVEVPPGEAAPLWLARVRACGVKAKIRTGGVTAGAFPSPAALLAFLEAAVTLDVPFKATAGLHHAVRGTYRLTYEPGSADAPMYGYLNVLLATAALQAGLPRAAAEALLVRTDAEALSFTDDAVRWGEVLLPVEALQQTRARGLVSIGSCSFREPVQELSTLHS